MENAEFLITYKNNESNIEFFLKNCNVDSCERIVQEGFGVKLAPPILAHESKENHKKIIRKS